MFRAQRRALSGPSVVEPEKPIKISSLHQEIADESNHWSGFYIGGNGGWGSSRNCWDFIDPAGLSVPEGCHRADGGVAGGQIGYRWMSGPVVFGVEGQGDWADLRRSQISTSFPDFTNRSRIDAFGLITGQVGYAWNNALFYFKGGAAVTSNRYDVLTTVGPVLCGEQPE
jgi:outer membrane immunogenic protein